MNEQATPVPPNWKWLVTAVAVVVGAAASAWLAWVNPPTEPTPPTPPASETRGFGWVRDDAAVERVRAELPCPRFDGTEAFRAAYAGPDDVFLWEACKTVTGANLPPRDQKGVGCCVGFGTAAAVEHLICVQIANGEPGRFREVSPEAIYGGSRVQVGHGRIRGDGSVGAWAVRFVQDYGVLPRAKYDRFDLLRYDEAVCRDIGRAGLTADMQTAAKDHPVKAVSNVKSFEEARAAVRNGYPVVVCSDQGFDTDRDADGFCPPRGSWRHCMALVGVQGGKRPGGFLLNSWGPDAHRGPPGAGDPSPAGFWADAAALDHMLGEGDSWALSGFVGFPPRTLDWYAKAR